MTSFNPINSGVQNLTTRECVVELNNLVTSRLDGSSNRDREVLQGKISALLNQVLSNGITPEQRVNIMNIRELASRAEGMHLISQEAKVALDGIAAKTKEIGLSLFTAPKDLTLQATDGKVEINSAVLGENSDFFKEMLDTLKDKDDKIIPVNLTTKAVEYLMRCLHAPEAALLELPDDEGMLPDLIRFIEAHNFDAFITKLEPAITLYLDKNRDSMVENRDSWLDALYIMKQSHPETATKWCNVITPRFLESCGVPVQPLESHGLFVVPVEHRNALFHEATRDLFKYLPLVLKIKDKNDLDLFLETCQSNKTESLLPIKLLSQFDIAPGEEERIKNIAKASNIQLSLEKELLPPGTTVFGKEQWETYFGDIGEAPPLPAGIKQLLESQCPHFPGRTWKDTHMLVLIPKTVGGSALTLNSLGELVQDPKGGGYVAKYDYVFDYIWKEHGNKAAERSHWILMSKDVIEGSRNQSYQQQQALVAAVPGCEVPDLLSAAVSIFTHFTHTGERLYSQDPPAYTRCKEITEGMRIIVGGFGAEGLSLDYNEFNTIEHPWYGVAALRKFVS